MTPETEIDALAQELGTIFLTTPPKVPYEWESAGQATKDAIYAVARHVLSQRIRAQREAYVDARKMDYTVASLNAHILHFIQEDANDKYPDLPSDAPRIEPLPQRGIAHDTRNSDVANALFDIWGKLNEVVARVNDLTTRTAPPETP